MRLDDKTAFITGGASGLGRSAAERFAEEGARVVVADLDTDGLDETVDLVEDTGGTAVSHELDVRDETAFRDVIDATVEEFGLDILLNNAGISHERMNVEEIGSEERDRLVGVNINGVWNGTVAALPHFKSQESGTIVNTASLAGVIGAPKLSAYSLTKGAVVNFTRAIAAEVGPHGIRVNAVCPGVTDTPMPRKSLSAEEWEYVKTEMAEQYPLKRLGEPEDIANAMLFLASDEADWITGETLVVDGGFSCS